MPKLTLEKEKPNKATLPFFVGIDIHAQIKELSSETGIPMRRLVEKMLMFSLANVEVIDVYDGEVL